MVSATIENGQLVIRLPIQEPAPSSSGKTLVVATSHGNKTTSAKVGDKAVVVGVNAYIYR